MEIRATADTAPPTKGTRDLRNKRQYNPWLGINDLVNPSPPHEVHGRIGTRQVNTNGLQRCWVGVDAASLRARREHKSG